MWEVANLLDNITLAVGEDWLKYICRDLEAIVKADVGCYDSRQRVIFIDSTLNESEATQQLIMELSNHQNRQYFAELDKDAKQLSRETYIELIERLEFAGVRNVIHTYDAACAAGLAWAPRFGCVYGAMRDKSFEEYYEHVSPQHRERYGVRHDGLLKS